MTTAQQRMQAVAACVMQLVNDDDSSSPIIHGLSMLPIAMIGDDHMMLTMAAGSTAKTSTTLRGAVDNFFETVVPLYSDATFFSHFRMSRISMKTLCDQLESHLLPAEGHTYIPADKKVHMAVWFLCNQDTFRQIANLFGMPNKGTSHYCIMQVCRAIVDNLRDTYIAWPDNNRQIEIATEFETRTGFPNVIGCIDGTHIAIKAPAHDRDSYINRKGFASVNVMAVCDHRMMFTEVFADRAGSVHDARVLRVSNLGHKLESGQSASIGQAQFHILGDSAYPLLPQLLIPYRYNAHMTPMQTKYNSIHSETRSLIERSFARLKGKLRRLRGLESVRMSNSLTIIEAAFVLHNFMLVHDSDATEYECDDDDESSSSSNQQDNSNATAAAIRQIAHSKRDGIANSF